MKLMLEFIIKQEAKKRRWDDVKVIATTYSKDEWGSPLTPKKGQFYVVGQFHAYFFSSAPISGIEGQFTVGGVSFDKSNMVVNGFTMGGYDTTNGAFRGEYGYTLTSNRIFIIDGVVRVKASPTNLNYLAHLMVMEVTRI